jgi:hypothetical protein
MKRMTKLVSLTLLIFFLGMLLFSLFHMTMSMDMSEGVSGCPFMSQEETFCPMNLLEHIGTWKSVVLFKASTLVVLLALAGLVTIVVSTAPNLLQKIHDGITIRHRGIRERTYTFIYRPLQGLFSNGILHPKLY